MRSRAATSHATTTSHAAATSSAAVISSVVVTTITVAATSSVVVTTTIAEAITTTVEVVTDHSAVNILATTYTIFQEYDTAMKYLLRAEKIDPNDPIVLKNIVDVDNMMGKKKLAKPYQARLDKLQEQMNDE